MFSRKNKHKSSTASSNASSASGASPSNASSTSSATSPKELSTRLERKHQEAKRKLTEADALYKQLQQLTTQVKQELQNVENIYNVLPSDRVTQSIDALTPILKKYMEQEQSATEKKREIDALYERIRQMRQSIQTILQECKKIETESNRAFTEAASTLGNLQSIAQTTKRQSDEAKQKIMDEIELEKRTRESLTSAVQATAQRDAQVIQQNQALQHRAQTLFDQCTDLVQYFYKQTEQQQGRYVYDKFCFPQKVGDVLDTLKNHEELNIVLAIAEAEMKKHQKRMPTQFTECFHKQDSDAHTPDYLKTEFQQLVKSIPIKTLKYETKSMADIAQLLPTAHSKWTSSASTCQQHFNNAQQKLTAFIDAYETARLEFKEHKVELLYPVSQVDTRTMLPVSAPFGHCIFSPRSGEVWCYCDVQTNGTIYWKRIETCTAGGQYAFIDYATQKVYTYNTTTSTPVEDTTVPNSPALFDTVSARYYTILRLVESGYVISSRIPENVRFTARNEYNRNEDLWLKKYGSTDYFRQLISYVGNPKKKPWEAFTVPLKCASTNVMKMEYDVNITFSIEGGRQLKVILTNHTNQTIHFTLAGPFRRQSEALSTFFGGVRTPRINRATFDTITLDDIQQDTYKRFKNKNKGHSIEFTFNNSLETYAFYLALTKGHSERISCEGDEDAFKQALEKRRGGRRTPTRRAPHAGLARTTRRKQKRVNVRKRRNRSGTHKRAINRGHGKVFTRRRI